MSSATLATQVATQLTFPWAATEAADCVRCSVSVAVPAPSEPVAYDHLARSSEHPSDHRISGLERPSRRLPASHVAPVANKIEPVNSVAESLNGDRLCKPIRVGSIMFRLLKSYGITDEEIAEGIAAYTAKHS